MIFPARRPSASVWRTPILEGDPYPVKAVFAAGMNHRMWPKPGRLLRALKELDFYVDVDMFWSDAARAADLVLPAQTSYEREEVYAKRGGRFYFADQAVEPLGEAKNDIQIIMDVMKAMGPERSGDGNKVMRNTWHISWNRRA